MKLNGWQRLWILVSAIYFLLVTSYVILEFPKAKDIPHQADFYKKLSKKSGDMINPTITETPGKAPWEVPKSKFKDADGLVIYETLSNSTVSPSDRWVSINPVAVEMPNKHVIIFNAELSENNRKNASNEYWQIIQRKALEKGFFLSLYAFLFWMATCLGLYALGWSIVWVYNGFKPNRS
jgi:hypothetical protein